MEEKRFEEAMKRLEEIVHNLERGDLSLEGSLAIFEEGMTLVAFCSKKLEEAQQKVTLLVKESDGRYSHQPFEIQEKNEE